MNKGNRVDREIERRMRIWKEWMEDECQYGDVVLTGRFEGAEVEQREQNCKLGDSY